MSDSTDFWTDIATTHRPGSTADTAPATDPPDSEETRPLGIAPAVPLPPAADPARSGVALHPRLRLALDELLDAESVQTHNLAILVGRVRPVVARRRRADDAHQRADTPAGRYQITDYGVREDLFRLEIQEVAGDDLDRAVTSYSMDLAISHRLLESGLFEDGQRLAICGPLRMERSYDARFATTPTDPGRPDWTTKLEVLTMLPVDETTPDGSLVELIGVVESEPRIRREPIGAGASEPFATVRLRCRRQLRSGIGRSRAVFSTSTVLPLEVPLSGDLELAGALLRVGNTVQVHGRLVQYRYQLPVRAPTTPTARAERKGVPEVLEDIAAVARARLAQRQPRADAAAVTREIRRAQQRFLTVIKPVIKVGYVELRHGTALDDAEIAELITHWRPRPTTDRTTPREERASSNQDKVAGALDTATAAAFPPEPSGAVSSVPTPGKPRRRPRAEVEPGATGDQETDDAA